MPCRLSAVSRASALLILALAFLTLSACDTFRAGPPTPLPAPAAIAPARSTPGPAALELERGDDLYARGDPEGAIAAYTHALELQPDYAEAYNNRAFVEWHAGNNQAALADFSRAIELRPDYVYALTNRAFVRYDLNDMPGCVADASRALELDPEDDSAFMIRGNALIRLGRWADALSDLLQANRIRTARRAQ